MLAFGTICEGGAQDLGAYLGCHCENSPISNDVLRQLKWIGVRISGSWSEKETGWIDQTRCVDFGESRHN